ncbi:MAG: helix-turn-helix domain-containing protein [Muribaculaceae bacterium]|nr:helix-turn-helix domain-containing protein [Muribaculaceae bacterium]
MQKERLKARREAVGLSQSDLARAVGLTPQAVSAYENGVRRADGNVIAAIADVLECSTDYLLGRTDAP